MAVITYLEGDATDPIETYDPVFEMKTSRIIAHICNDVGAWGAGFVLALSKRWPMVERDYRQWAQGEFVESVPFKLGQVRFVRVDMKIYVANMVAQMNSRPVPKGEPLVQYDALAECLGEVAQAAILKDSATVHMPRIGTGIAGGRWELIEPLLQEFLVEEGISVYVYDFPQPQQAPQLMQQGALA